MASDPRSFMVVPCNANRQKQVRRDTGKKGFFGKIGGALGKVGDIEGLGEVGEGLRVLNDVSEANRMGRAKSVINEYDVFDATSVDSAAFGEAAQFNPGVLNRGVAEAKNIADKVNGGNFDLTDIPGAFQDIQNLGSLVRGIFPGGGGETEPAMELCGAEPYATDLIRHAPKFKYMFVVQITFDPSISNNQERELGGALAFVCKHSTRPTVEFEYEEVNQYNFRTRVPKRTVYPPVTMRFYDDNLNSCTRFQDLIMMAMSPVSVGGKFDTPNMSREWLAAQAMNSNFADGAVSTASLGPNFTGDFQLIKNIKLFHVFEYGKLMNVYTFHNPKPMTITPDEVDSAETGNGSEMELQFAYDAVSIEADVSIQNSTKYNIQEVSTNGKKAIYGIDPIFSEADPGLNKIEASPADGLLAKIGSGIDFAVGKVGDEFGEFSKGAEDFASDAFKRSSGFVGSIFK